MPLGTMDGGEKAFCGGVEIFTDQISPGLGDFIHAVVKKAMEDNGLQYTEPTKKSRRHK